MKNLRISALNAVRKWTGVNKLMKSNIKGGIENQLEEIWQATQRSINLSKAVLLLAMVDYFGLGKKRMESFLEFYNDIAKKHIEYEKDGIHVEKINEALKKFDTDFDTLFGHETLKEAERSIRIQKRSQKVDYADAISVRKKLERYAKYVEVKEKCT